MLEMLQMELVQSVIGVVGGVADVLPRLLAALIFIILGFVFGGAVGRVISEIVRSLKIDEMLTKAGVAKVFSRGGYELNSGAFLGWLAKLFFVVIFLIAGFNILGLTQINEFLLEVLAYIPQVVVATMILFVASFAAEVLSGMVSGATKAVGSHVAHLLGSITRWAIWTFAIIIALSHLGIAPQYMYTLFAGMIAMLALAGGLAFGLGGKDAAADLIREIRTDIRQGK